MNQLVLLILASSAVRLCEAAQLPSPPSDSLSHGHQIAALLAQADTLSWEGGENRRALALYAEALSLDKRSPEILWRISQSYVRIADDLASEEQELRLSLYEKALEFADKSVSANGHSSMAFTRRGIASARVALFKGFWESMGILKDARADLERALELDSLNHEAHFALATTHLKVIEKPWILRWPLGLGWGDIHTAIAHLERAIELKWNCIEYRLAAARAYIEEDEPAKARAHLTLIPMLRAVNRTDLIAAREARSLLDHLETED